MIEWQWRNFAELSNKELYQILALRMEVFVLGQQCCYQDCDFRDFEAKHLLGWQDQQLVAYMRVLATKEGEAMSFGRVLTAPSVRGQGIGKQLLTQGMDYLNTYYADQPIRISAQYYLLKFYQYYGFQAVGEPYEEEGITHILMVKE